ncbi:MAG: SRPBCC family protein [Hyphomicrobiaceae bacterium]|nr:SRPBCC family protein [Hyphomicrobiaceae bacterium]
MKLTSTLLVATAAAMLSITAAHAGSVVVGKKLEIEVDEKKMTEEKAALWAKFGGWCAIAEWHPALSGCEETKEGDKAFRILTLKDGAKIKELLLEKSDFGYKYQIIESPLPVKNYMAQFSLTPDDDDTDEVNFSWSATFDPEGKTAKEAKDVIEGIFKGGLAAIEAQLETKK